MPGGGAGARRGEGQQRLPGSLYGGVPGGAGEGVAVTGAAGGGVRGGGVQRLGGGPALLGRGGRTRAGAMPTSQAQTPGRRAASARWPGIWSGSWRDEEGGGADEGQDHVARRPDRVASHSVFCTAASRAPTVTRTTALRVREAVTRATATPPSMPSTAHARVLPRAAQLVVTTAALRRLEGRQLDAVLAHEKGHAQARHDWLLHCSIALADGFPRVPVFAAFRDEMHRLVELAADDVASRRFGRLTTALALIELNEGRGIFGPCPAAQAQVPQRVHRLLTPPNRLTAGRRLRLTAAAALVPAVPVLVAFAPGLRALG
ncbi:hypothetical protein STENM223S_04455 [Streptomyces tendae]